MMHPEKVIVIGGGIVGLAVAYKLLRQFPGMEVTVLEKEKQTGTHQSTHNSGVLHCGLYYKPGSLKARLAVSGIRQMVQFCRDHEISHEICGKLVVATDPAEVGRLKTLQERGAANGLTGIRWLQREEMLEIEPHVAGSAALHVPEEGIVDYRKVCDTLQSEIGKLGGQVLTGAAVTRCERKTGRWRVETEQETRTADFIFNCAGLHCDRVSRMAGESPASHIIPFRGEYFQIRPERQNLVRHLIYPVPDPAYPFLGVHFTRLIHGGVEAGPNAVLALAREAYRKTQFNLFDLGEVLAFPGFWRFAFRHAGMCRDELLRSFSKRLFCESLQKLVPDIQIEDLTEGGSGIRAQAMLPDGSLIQDFEMIESPHALHLLNAPSPAATASLAIADEVLERAKKSFL